MAILNLTPDSFSDGGQHSPKPDAIVQTVRRMIDEGAHIIDIGGQSTRPNAEEISTQAEIDRVIPAIRSVRKANISIPISIDTYRSEVAKAAIQAGADMINDVSAGTLDPDMFQVGARLNVPIILMHMRGNPKTMNSLAEYDGDLIETIGQELSARVNEAIRSGIRRWNILLDPGLGFAKNSGHNLEIIRRFGELRQQQGLGGMPWVLGPSRKRFISGITGEDVARERIWGTAGAIAACVQGGADVVRVHDVAEMSKVVKMSDAIWRNIQSS
jgi:dihydroneopterin aldolase / 2-amino-4-hydroxy-6-hydroxymethyldihydropteridine diphosphokinase / dihydropteroate synthase